MAVQGRCTLAAPVATRRARNIALEDERCIYIDNPKNTVQVKLNNMLVVGGETVHGGIAYVNDTSEKPLKYHPSLGLVFESKQFKRCTNMVGLPKMQLVYTSLAHIWKLSKIELEERLKRSCRTVCEPSK